MKVLLKTTAIIAMFSSIYRVEAEETVGSSEIEEVFQLFDVNGDQILSREEMINGIGQQVGEMDEDIFK